MEVGDLFRDDVGLIIVIRMVNRDQFATGHAGHLVHCLVAAKILGNSETLHAVVRKRLRNIERAID